ncbi:MAG: hypothetical protein RR367_04725 [Clostridia bacterium]
MKPWLLGALGATLLLAVTALCLGLRFASPGDSLILKAFAGFEGGVPVHYHEELHTTLAWLLFALHSAVPGIPWFSVLQLAFLWLSCAVVIKSMARCAELHGLPAWLGALCGGLWFACIGLFSMVRLEHGATGALLCAAAVSQLFSSDYSGADDRHVLRGTLLSTGLLIAGYCFSMRAAAPALCFVLLGALTVRLTDYSHREVARRGMLARKGARGLTLGMWICVFCLMLFMVMRLVELDAMAGDAAWQSARRALVTNPAFPAGVTDELLDQIGWSRTQLDLFASGFLYDSQITADSLRLLNEGLTASAHTGLGTAWSVLSSFFAKHPSLMISGGLCAALALLCVLTAAGHKRVTWMLLVPIVTLAAALGWLLVLAQSGRLHMDEALCVLAPAGTLLLGLALYRPASAPQGRKLPQALLCTFCAIAAGVGIVNGAAAAAKLPVEQPAFEAALYEYALSKPDKLIFYTPRLASDTRLFPNLQAAPHNVVLPDVRNVHTNGLAIQLKQFGIECVSMKPSDFLKPSVLVAGTAKGPWKLLLPYVNELQPGTYNWAVYEQKGDLYLYKLCKR